jgi:hypothetical protein
MTAALGWVLMLALGQTSPGYYTEAEAQTLFTQATEAAARGEHGSAQEGLQKLLDRGFGGADVLYNLGTSHLASGRLGLAVLYLERARRLGLGDEDIEANLQLARSKQLDQVIGDGGGPFVQRVVESTSGTAAAWLFLVPWVLGFGALVLRRVWRKAPATLGPLAVVCLLACIPTGLLFAGHVYVRAHVREGVVTEPKLAARELPRDAAKVSFEIHEGLKVRVLEQSDGFVRIRLPNGLEGWAARAGVTEI